MSARVSRSPGDAPYETFGAKLDGYIARKGEFRNRILDAAEDLIAKGGGTSFSMQELASRAGVSAATPFNHFRSKRGLLSAIVERSIERLGRVSQGPRKGADPLERMFEQADAVLGHYAQKSQLYRPVFGELVGSETGAPPRALLQANAFWRTHLQAAFDAGQLQQGRNLDVIAHQLETNWIGSLMLWINKALDGSEWKTQAQYGTALALASVSSKATHPQIAKRIVALEKRLAQIIPGSS